MRWWLPSSLVLLTISAPVPGQTGGGERDQPPQETGDPQAATEGMLPDPDYSEDWMTRLFLTGDWGGTRQEWANDGVSFNLEWFQVGQGVVSGGRNERWSYVTNLDLYSKLDLMRMGVMPGALVSFRGQSRFGETINADTFDDAIVLGMRLNMSF